MKNKIIQTMFLLLIACHASAQLVLTADGPGNTYERINAALAPGYDVVEHPECAHAAFGRHIAEVFDADLNQHVFEFYAHVNEDNDRCINFDRQRIEIKTYDQSPDSLIGTTGEFITYKWRFKIPAGFKPSSSFTHIHQIKPVNGDDDQPLFTLTARKGTPNKMELIHVVSGTSGTNKVSIVNLSAFEGAWVEATEQILVGLNGAYSMNIRRVSDGASLMSYANSNINTIRSNNDFIRPKWGIYRSLNTPADLRDESIRFSYFSIKEGLEVLPVDLKSFDASAKGDGVLLRWTTTTETGHRQFIIQRSADGISFIDLATVPAGNNSNGASYQYTDTAAIPGNNFYRLKIADHDGGFTFSEKRLVRFSSTKQQTLLLYPNPVKNEINLSLPGNYGLYQLEILSPDGRLLFRNKNELQHLNKSVNHLLTTITPGLYLVKMHNRTTMYTSTFIKQ